jgi:IS30 family transposase
MTRGFVLGRPAISVEVQRLFWASIREGEIIDTAAAAVGVSKTVGWRWFREAGGVMPPQRAEPLGRPARLSFADREEIACRRAAGEGVRAIARAIGRSPSTISRELARGIRRPKTGYRATVAQALADERARRPKIALLQGDTRLRAYVERQLVLKHSPEQSAGGC